MEKLFYTDVDFSEFDNTLGMHLYRTLEPFLDRITPITLETKLWSNTLQMNGRVDCIGYLDDVLTVIDFKSSLKEKREAWITDYFLQATYYAMMIHDLIAVPINQIAILIAVEQGSPQLFVRQTKEFVKSALLRVRAFRELQTKKS